MREGFKPTPLTVTSESGISDAATKKKAAELKSAGTAIGPMASVCTGLTLITPGPSGVPSRSTRAPAYAIMRSV